MDRYIIVERINNDINGNPRYRLVFVGMNSKIDHKKFNLTKLKKRKGFNVTTYNIQDLIFKIVDDLRKKGYEEVTFKIIHI